MAQILRGHWKVLNAHNLPKARNLDGRRPCEVGLTQQGAFWLSCGRLRLGGRVEARGKEGNQ